MNFTNSKILKEKMKDEEEGLIILSRLTKLNFLPKFCRLDVQVSDLGIFINGYFLDRF